MTLTSPISLKLYVGDTESRISSNSYRTIYIVTRFVFSTIHGLHQSSVVLSATKLLTVAAVACAIWVLVTQIVDVISLGVAVAVAVVQMVDVAILGVVVAVIVTVVYRVDAISVVVVAVAVVHWVDVTTLGVVVAVTVVVTESV